MKKHLIQVQQSLEEKLESISKGGKVSLTKAEAVIYGIHHSDVLPQDNTGKEIEDDQ